jgi:hypothetical protein
MTKFDHENENLPDEIKERLFLPGGSRINPQTLVFSLTGDVRCTGELKR